jgi:pimeloyl-ACP methyl ester carboxylesterase
LLDRVRDAEPLREGGKVDSRLSALGRIGDEGLLFLQARRAGGLSIDKQVLKQSRQLVIRRGMARIATVLAIAALACLSGPQFPFKPRPSGVQRTVAAAPDLDVFLRAAEDRHPQIKPGLAKGIVWNDPARKTKTPIAIVHLHGFSASRKDISPVVETVAPQLRANAFFAPLAAHGLSNPEEFATVTPQDWLDDAREALAVGRRLGDRVILVGISTGALLATLAVLEDNSNVAALVLLSPNFGLSDWRARFISGPVGPWLARIAIGREYSFEPATKGHAEFWTPRYPSQAVVALMDLLNYARTLRLSALYCAAVTTACWSNRSCKPCSRQSRRRSTKWR